MLKSNSNFEIILENQIDMIWKIRGLDESDKINYKDAFLIINQIISNIPMLKCEN